jgi:CMP-N,N'-diacetyllegionaminic acid synthase
MNKKKILGVIPARGGSKGIPGKNLIKISGKPLIQYTIEASKKSKLLTEFIISTDSEEIANFTRSVGGNAPFLRPENLSSDKALSLPAILHALNFMEKVIEDKYDIIVMLQPTTPLRSYEDIDNAISILLDKHADSVISVTDVGGHHPLRMKRIVNGRLINYIDQGVEDMRPRQDLPPVYIRNGAIYAAFREILIEKNSFSGNNCYAFNMPAERSINIDTLDDLTLAKKYINDN